MSVEKVFSKVRRYSASLQIKTFRTSEAVKNCSVICGKLAKRKKYPRRETVLRIAQILSVDPSYLAGESDIVTNPNHETTPSKPLVFQENPEVPESKPVSPKHHGGPYYGTTNLAPVVSWARAGSDSFAYEDLANQIDEFIPTNCKDANCFWIRLEGDSMMPRFEPGDYVICMPNVQAQTGNLVIVRTSDGGVYFKLFHRIGEGGLNIQLRSYNPLYPPMDFHAKDIVFAYPAFGAFKQLRHS